MSSSKNNSAHGTGGSQTEQHFNVLPHPAKSNNPADLDPVSGFASNPGIMAHHARQPHVPSQELLNKLDEPLSREELRRRAEELNK